MTDRDHRLSLTRQAELLGISRGSLYYAPRLTSAEDLKLMRANSPDNVQVKVQREAVSSLLPKGTIKSL